MANSRARAGKVQNKPRTLWPDIRLYPKNDEACLQDTEPASRAVMALSNINVIHNYYHGIKINNDNNIV